MTSTNVNTTLTTEFETLKPNEIFKKNSPYTENDDKLVSYILQNEVIDYKCYTVKCPTKKGNWKRKKLPMILKRKDGITNNLELKNIELICPNCYYLEKGSVMELKKNKKNKCESCNVEIEGAFQFCRKCYYKHKTASRNMIDNILFNNTQIDISGFNNTSLLSDTASSFNSSGIDPRISNSSSKTTKQKTTAKAGLTFNGGSGYLTTLSNTPIKIDEKVSDDLTEALAALF